MASSLSRIVASGSNRTLPAALLVCAAAIVPYLPTVDDYFVRDDFGVVQLLAQKPATYFPRWFVTSWMDDIWGFLPDEIRPFPAVSYQLTALGGAASPVLHHVLNILIHAANGLLVLALARTAAGLTLTASAVAALTFVLLPVQTESVAWITGRVDSMPALFYLGSFLAYVLWRQRVSQVRLTASAKATAVSPKRFARRRKPDATRPHAHLYVASLAIFLVALFTKQNTITMVGTLVAYDVIVGRPFDFAQGRRAIRPIVSFVLPYVPYAVMTAGYLWLRYALFGQVAREDALNARGLHDFQVIVSRHIRHVVSGDSDGSQSLVWLALVLVAVAGLATVLQRPGETRSHARVLLYFGPVWWAIGIAPIVVAGYSSPRHVYLAVVGWAIVIGLAFDLLSAAARIPYRRHVALASALVMLIAYAVGLQASIRAWGATAAVSQDVVREMRSAALASPEGSLVIVGAPGRSWEWALPFAARPPFVRTDLTERAHIISPRALSCCAGQWFDQTRAALRAWSTGPSREVAVAMRWDPQTGALSKATSNDTPQLTALMRSLLDMGTPDQLDRNLTRMIDVLCK
jgi:hypothetical protein